METIPNNNGQIVTELLRFGASLSTSYAKKIYKAIMGDEKPPQPFVKVFVVGDSSSGKSTLVAALKQVTWLTSSKLYLFSRQVHDVPMLTTGITPYEFESPYCGNIALHDFAGHRELHSGQAAVIQSAVRHSPPIFLLVVDISKDTAQVKQSVEYWMSFIGRWCMSENDASKAHAIIVGSHTDLIHSRHRKDVIRTIKTVVQECKEFSGLVDLNCLYPDSRQMTELRELLAKDCEKLRMKDPLRFNAHCFLKYLKDTFTECGVQLQTVLTSMNENPTRITSFIPNDEGMLVSICQTLHNRGHILFLQRHGNMKIDSPSVTTTADMSSWIIINKAPLLEKITGSKLAPMKSQQHIDLASSTGIVSLSKVKSQIYSGEDIHNTSSVDPEMLVEFMSHLEICHEILDVEVLPKISQQHTLAGERYFIFPILFAKEPPRRVWKPKEDLKYHCGWILRCIGSDQYFTSKLFTVLVPKLIYSVSATGPTDIDDLNDCPAFQQPCSVWKNGIYWSNDDGGEVLLEFFESSKTIMIRFRHKTLTADCLRLRSNVIKVVQNVANDLCPRVTTKEYFVDPSDDICNHPPGQDVFGGSICDTCDSLAEFESHFNVYSLNSIATSVARSKDNSKRLYVKSTRGTQITLEGLLCFEPYAVISRFCRDILLDPKSLEYVSGIEMNQLFPHNLLFRDHYYGDVLIELLNLDCTESDFDEATMWYSSGIRTYMDLHEKLKQLSIFEERNHLICEDTPQQPVILPEPDHEPDTGPEPGPVPEDPLKLPQRDEMPELHQLQLLKGRGQVLRVMESIGPRWKQLAIALSFDQSRINSIERNSHYITEDACLSMLMRWQNGEHDLKPCTWANLILALQACGERALANSLKSICLTKEQVKVHNKYAARRVQVSKDRGTSGSESTAQSKRLSDKAQPMRLSSDMSTTISEGDLDNVEEVDRNGLNKSTLSDVTTKDRTDKPPRHQPYMVPDKDVTVCMRCQTIEFSWYYRKHHCRNCGAVVCWACSKHRLTLPDMTETSKPVRVCDDCYNVISSGQDYDVSLLDD